MKSHVQLTISTSCLYCIHSHTDNNQQKSLNLMIMWQDLKLWGAPIWAHCYYWEECVPLDVYDVCDVCVFKSDCVVTLRVLRQPVILMLTFGRRSYPFNWCFLVMVKCFNCSDYKWTNWSFILRVRHISGLHQQVLPLPRTLNLTDKGSHLLLSPPFLYVTKSNYQQSKWKHSKLKQC